MLGLIVVVVMLTAIGIVLDKFGYQWLVDILRKILPTWGNGGN